MPKKNASHKIGNFLSMLTHKIKASAIRITIPTLALNHRPIPPDIGDKRDQTITGGRAQRFDY